MTSQPLTAGAPALPDLNRPLVRWLVGGFWLLVAVINFSQSAVSDYINFDKIDWPRHVILSGGWLIWFFLTPLVVRIARCWSLEQNTWYRSLLFHLAAGLGIATIHWLTEAGLLRLIWTTNPIPLAIWLVKLSYKFHVNILIYFAVAGAYYALAYYHQYRTYQYEASRLELKTTQLEASLAQAQLQSLKMQLNPHFLFNTHHAIMSLVLQDRKEQAVRMLNRLSDLLRMTLESTHEPEIPLRQELEVVSLYLEIQQIRFENRLQVRMEVDPDCLPARVPNMFLQPLVENAVQHGIAPYARSGTIQLGVARRDSRLELTVCDSGPGLNGEAREGTGLRNTLQRLETMYGPDHRFTLENPASGGLLVTIQIPFRP
ncbi:sensor histidine kinase [Larkinella soli]|uniref:sensor histidine kinase n=1 Tax=Larkinella soli TaxID=1770527 RepID=UPI000FFC8D36|nr:histidine kinase [Larkinella soli]